MAGFLSDMGSAPPSPAMQYYGGQQPQGALSSQPIFPGVDPSILDMMYGSAGPESPYAKQLYETSRDIMGEPKEISGALSSANKNYDQAVEQKKNAIQMAMSRLSALQAGQTTNLPLMAGAVGALQPTRTGSIGETIGNSFAAAIPQIEKQRQIEEGLAQTLSDYGIAGAETGIAGAQGDVTNLDTRLRIADTMANQAGQIQGRQDLITARNRAGVLQYAGRIQSADINANKNRYQYLGNDPQDGTVGRYLDKTTNQVFAGPAVAKQQPPAAEWKYNIWLKNHPGDTAGAEDFAAGHRTMPPEQMRAAALRQAQQELGVGADKASVDSRAQELYGEISGGFGGQPAPAPAPQPQGAPAPAGGGQIAPRPQNAGPDAKWSPSAKQWWWHDAAGNWAHS